MTRLCAWHLCFHPQTPTNSKTDFFQLAQELQCMAYCTTPLSLLNIEILALAGEVQFIEYCKT